MMKDLEIKIIDRVKCGPKWSWVSDTNGWQGFHIWCVEEGGAQITEGSNVYKLLPGDIFLFDLSFNHICTHDPSHPLCVTTVYFTCDTREGGSRLIRQDEFLCEALKRGRKDVEEGRMQQGYLWLQSAICEILEYQQTSRMLPKAVAEAICMMEASFPETLTLEQLSAAIGYSKNQLIRLFRQHLGVTPVQYALKKKMEYARGMLVYSSLSIGEIAYHAGYDDQAYFANTFKKYTGCTPTAFRNSFSRK